MTYGVPPAQDWNALTDEQFRHMVRREFEDNYPQHLRYVAHRMRWHENGSWYLRMAQQGWIAPNWPREYGGMGLDPGKLLIFIEEGERWGIGRFLDLGIQMVGPLLIRWGTDAQRRRFLPGILSCEHRWCQGYSEPGSGSDLASLRTRAELDGAELVINGQKIWTTLAHDATHMFALVRTDPHAKKQEGIGFVLIEMSSPGITVRPIRDFAGHEEFCEVFLDNVRMPMSNVVGELNGGWTVAKSLLGFERIFIGSPKLPEYGIMVLERAIGALGLAADSSVRDRLAQYRIDVLHLGNIYEKFAERARRGEPVGDDVSLLKIWATETFQAILTFAVEICGPEAVSSHSGIGAMVLPTFYRSRPPTIFGGSNEIQRNIIAKNVLGLPSAAA
jgi:alkylation response protein AidB-like acyl-CoA dehydrogenase